MSLGSEDRMRKNSGNALLVVTLLSVVMVMTAMGLVTLTSSQYKASYGLNNHVSLRYGAEAGLEDLKLRLFKDRNDPTNAWFTAAFANGLSAADKTSYNANILSGPYTGVTPILQITLGSVATNTRPVQVNVFCDKVANNNSDYQARVVSYIIGETANAYKDIMKMRFTYATTAVTQQGVNYFSKYAMFMNTWNPYLVWSHEIFDGDVHSNQNMLWGFKDARFYGKTTYVTTADYYTGWVGAWTAAEKAAVTPGGLSQVAPITMPTFADFSTQILPIVQAGPQQLYVSANAASGPWAGKTITNVNVYFTWDNTLKQNYAYIQAYNGATLVDIIKYDIPKNGTDVVIYTDKKTTVKGIVQGRVTLAVNSSAAGIGNDLLISDDIVYIDDNGRPKQWVYRGGTTAMNASNRTILTEPVDSTKGMSGRTFRYSFTGMTNNTTSNVNSWKDGTTIQNWDGVAYKFMQNPSYLKTYRDPCLGIVSAGDITFRPTVQYNSIQCFAMYTQNDGYHMDMYGGSPMKSKGNMAKFGSLVTNTIDADGDGNYSGIAPDNMTYEPWVGYGRFLPYNYDQSLMTDPPPSFVKIPGAVTTTTINVTIGVSYFLGNNY